ncbi:hypothetical protein NL676_000431 [Syzygium grande]|nr:hypothetical protein NL676_000431 [Syzygium grande]
MGVSLHMFHWSEGNMVVTQCLLSISGFHSMSYLFMKEKLLSVHKSGCFRLLNGGFGPFQFVIGATCSVKIWLNQPGDDILKSLQKRLLLR